MFIRKFFIYLLLTYCSILAQNKIIFLEDIQYVNEQTIIQTFYNDDEDSYIEAATFFYDNKNKLKLGNEEATNTFNQIKVKFKQLINSYTNSNLIDDAQLAIAEAAKYLDDKELYETELQKVIDTYPDQHLTYLNFEHPICNSILPAMQSSFVQTDAYAKLQLAMIYYSSTIITSELDYKKAIDRFDEVIDNYPYSYCTAVAQYYKAICFDILSLTTNLDKNIVADEYEKVFDLYKNYSIKFSESALGRIGDYAIKFLPSQMNALDEKIKNFYSPNNYLAESRFQTNANSKWNKTELKIHFERSGNHNTKEDSIVVNDVVIKFNNYLSSNISLSLTSNKFDSDIQIEFSNSKGNFTQLDTRNNSESINEITSAKIYLRNNSNIVKRKEILLHELGHGIGLDHSFDSNDNLYFSGNNSFEYSERDLQTIKDLYSKQNSAPEFLTIPYSPRISPGEKIYLDINVQDFDFDSPIYSIANKPDWLEIDNVNGIITGTPTSSNIGYHEFWIHATDENYSSNQTLWKFMVSSDPSVTGIDNDSNNILKENLFYSPYPNPFNPTTSVKFSLTKDSFVELYVFNLLGEVIQKQSQIYSTGLNSLRINLENTPSGTYIYSIFIDKEKEKSGKIILIK